MADTVLRRQFELPAEDEEYLDAHGYTWETVVIIEGDGRALWLFLQRYPLPSGYCGMVADALQQLENTTIGIRVTGYPGGALDMAYFYPPMRRADGKTIPAVSDLTLDGKTYQQWSRHYTPVNPFRVGIDSISTHLGVVDEWLRREFHR